MRSVVMPDSATDDRDSNEYSYCYCKEELGGEMIHSNNVNCPHTHSHGECQLSAPQMALLSMSKVIKKTK